MSNENLNLEANSGDRQRVLYLSEFSQLNHLRKLHLTSIGVASNISSGASDDSNCSTDSEEEQRANVRFHYFLLSESSGMLACTLSSNCLNLTPMTL